jgi:hypothetical protein
MDAYSFNALRFEAQDRMERRSREAAAERQAREMRTHAAVRVGERLQRVWGASLARVGALRIAKVRLES